MAEPPYKPANFDAMVEAARLAANAARAAGGDAAVVKRSAFEAARALAEPAPAPEFVPPAATLPDPRRDRMEREYATEAGDDEPF